MLVLPVKLRLDTSGRTELVFLPESVHSRSQPLSPLVGSSSGEDVSVKPGSQARLPLMEISRLHVLLYKLISMK